MQFYKMQNVTAELACVLKSLNLVLTNWQVSPTKALLEWDSRTWRQSVIGCLQCDTTGAGRESCNSWRESNLLQGNWVIYTKGDIFPPQRNGTLSRYIKLWVAHALGMPGTFCPPPNWTETANKRSRHASRLVRHARAVMHVGIANPQCRGKRS